MTAYVPPTPSRIRLAAREVEQIAFQMAMVAELIEAAEERIGEHFGGDRTVNDRATAMLIATGHLLRNARAAADALIERMLDASDN